MTGLLAIMLVVAPLRAVMALPMGGGDLCASMSGQGNDLQPSDQVSSGPDTGHSIQDQGCCGDQDSTCTSDCQVSISLSYAPVETSPVKTHRQHLLNDGFKASVVPTGTLTPLLRPPATLHS